MPHSAVQRVFSSSEMNATQMRPSTAAGRTACMEPSVRLSLRHVCPAPAFRSTRPTRIVTAASSSDDEELEKRLEKLRLAKGATPYGQGSKASKRPSTAGRSASPSPQLGSLNDSVSGKGDSKKKVYDYTNETTYYEGPPHRGDLAVNIALGTTLIWLPLTIAAIGRCAFVNYKFTDRRISVTTEAPWKQERLDCAYEEVKEVRSLGRGLGFWGDMVVELKDGSKIEFRSLDRFRELEKYILQRRDELTEPEIGVNEDGVVIKPGRKGFK